MYSGEVHCHHPKFQLLAEIAKIIDYDVRPLEVKGSFKHLTTCLETRRSTVPSSGTKHFSITLNYHS